MTLQEFVASAGVSMTVQRATRNPNMEDSRGMHHYACKIEVGRSRMTVPFSMGPALLHEPTVTDVLDCLASDAGTFENAKDFEDWCGELGYDADSRKAERIFKTIEKQANKLRTLLGESAYETLLWKTERD